MNYNYTLTWLFKYSHQVSYIRHPSEPIITKEYEEIFLTLNGWEMGDNNIKYIRIVNIIFSVVMAFTVIFLGPTWTNTICVLMLWLCSMQTSTLTYLKFLTHKFTATWPLPHLSATCCVGASPEHASPEHACHDCNPKSTRMLHWRVRNRRLV